MPIKVKINVKRIKTIQKHNFLFKVVKKLLCTFGANYSNEYILVKPCVILVYYRCLEIANGQLKRLITNYRRNAIIVIFDLQDGSIKSSKA